MPIRGKVAVRIGIGYAIELSECDCLNHGVALRGTQIEIGHGLLPIQTMQQLPGSVREIEEWFTVSLGKKALVVANSEAG